MKHFFVMIVSSLLWASLFSQAPEGMSFQAVIRDANSNLVQNSQVGIQISVLHGSVNGVALFIERHTPMTNDNGLVTLEIGNGTPVMGTLSIIDWGNGPYFLKTETDLTGGTNYTISGTSQLLSVPYAMFADSANEHDPDFNNSVASGITSGDTSNWNNDQVNDADSDPGNELQTLTLLGDTLILSGSPASTVLLPTDSAIWSKNADSVYYSGGNVGVGTSSPYDRLHVSGRIRSDSLVNSDTLLLSALTQGQISLFKSGSEKDLMTSLGAGRAPQWVSPVFASTGFTDTIFYSSARMTWVSDPTMQLVVPQNGIYRVSISTRIDGINSGDQWWKCRLWNITQNQAVGPPAFFGLTTLGATNGDVGIYPHFRTSQILNAGDVLQLQYFVQGSGGSTWKSGDANGYRWIELEWVWWN